MKILVVGDKDYERQPLAANVKALGHQVHEADDGTTAWEAYKAEEFDVIISDFLMPQMNGLELTRKVREEPQSTYTYIIICSSQNRKKDVMAGFESGVDDYIAKPMELEELKCRLISSVRVTNLHRELAAKNTQLKAMGDNLRAESRRDPLTNVGNRLRFTDDVKRYIDQYSRYGHSFYLGLVDIDNFKLYNDTYGHLEGDDVLKRVARALADGSRASDEVYRMGGEEFLLVFADQDEDGAFIAADRIRQAVEDLDVTHCRNEPYGKVTITVGLAPFTAKNREEVDLDLQKADVRLYKGKSAGRNRVVRETITAPT